MQFKNTPPREEVQKALQAVACTVSAHVLLTSRHYPDLRQRGRIGTPSGAPGLYMQV